MGLINKRFLTVLTLTTQILSASPERLQDEGKLETVPELRDPATIHAISLGL